MGDQAEQKFTQAWGTGLAISQATQFKDMAVVALEAAAVLTVMEALWLIGNKPWLEEHIDFASVHATIAADKAATLKTRLHAHLAYFSAVA